MEQFLSVGKMSQQIPSCIGLLVIWKASTTLRSTSEVRRRGHAKTWGGGGNFVFQRPVTPATQALLRRALWPDALNCGDVPQPCETACWAL